MIPVIDYTIEISILCRKFPLAGAWINSATALEDRNCKGKDPQTEVSHGSAYNVLAPNKCVLGGFYFKTFREDLVPITPPAPVALRGCGGLKSLRY